MNRRERRKQRIAKQSAIRSTRNQPLPDPAVEPAEIVEPAACPVLPETQPGELREESHAAPQAKPERSAGPRTEEGKSISSRNAVKHGLCAQKLTGPDLEFLNAIRARLNREWEPKTETENMLLAQMALSQWRLERALELELAALAGDIDPAALTLALRYRTSAERTFFKSLAELQRLRASMRQDAEREGRREQEDEEAIIRQLEAQILKPYAPFVSQNRSGADSGSEFVSQNARLEHKRAA